MASTVHNNLCGAIAEQNLLSHNIALLTMPIRYDLNWTLPCQNSAAHTQPRLALALPTVRTIQYAAIAVLCYAFRYQAITPLSKLRSAMALLSFTLLSTALPLLDISFSATHRLYRTWLSQTTPTLCVAAHGRAPALLITAFITQSDSAVTPRPLLIHTQTDHIYRCYAIGRDPSG